MDPETGLGSFDRLTLKGRSVGAAMTIRHEGAVTGEHQGACCINIYVNNNIQGANNSILVESEMNMRDPGVSISLEDFNIGKPKKRTKSKKKNKNTQVNDASVSNLVGFPAILIAFIILLILFLTIS